MTLPTGATKAPLIVGIDIGGTKTHLRAEGGGQLCDLIRPTADWRRRDWGLDAAALLALAHELADGAPIAAIGVGAHGCDDAEECATFQSAFDVRTDIPVAVVNDAELMPLAFGLHGQIGLVAGTGSIAVCRPEGGKMLVAGGWGWIIGDEGSAASLVREACRSVAGHLDAGGSMDEPLTAAIFRSLAIPSPSRIGSVLGKLGDAAAVGSHAHVVFEAAEQGSLLARQVIREGGEALARLVQTLDRCGAGARHVVAGGSVIVSQPPLWTAFTEALAALCGDCITPHVFTGRPVEGACRLAATLVSGTAQQERTTP